ERHDPSGPSRSGIADHPKYRVKAASHSKRRAQKPIVGKCGTLKTLLKPRLLWTSSHGTQPGRVMPLSFKQRMEAGLALAALLAGGYAGPAQADVKAGVDAWSQGDYAGAVREGEAPAAAGDPDALFNLAQAYRLGRGVPTDPARAEALYARAAADGHLQAADIYGLMLFEQGRREQALPYIRDASRR